MSENKKEVAKLCLKCHDMYGSPSFNQMCSLCYKEHLAETKNQAIKEDKPSSQPQDKNLELVQKKTESDRLEEKIIQAEKRYRAKILLKETEQCNCNPIPEQTKKQTKKCIKCSKKVGMLGYSCKHCSSEFCKLHRLPEDHDCQVDFISLGRKQLKLDNPALQQTKIQKI